MIYVKIPRGGTYAVKIPNDIEFIMDFRFLRGSATLTDLLRELDEKTRV